MNTDQHESSYLAPKKIVWVVNPFDQLPNETDVPLRYWALCRTLAALGHEVIWWSSDFSHLTKSKRTPCPNTDGFSVRLIETPPYSKNISFARLKNHKAFAQGFYNKAMADLKNGALKAPNRIVVSLPPLGVAEQAFKIRDNVNQRTVNGRSRVASAPDPHATAETANWALKQPSYAQPTPPCQVIVDIMDAWPETFYRALPSPLRKTLGPILLAPMHRSAQRAYEGADKISAVGQSYLDLAQKYLGQEWKVESEKWEGEEDRCQKPEDREQGTKLSQESPTPHFPLPTLNSAAKPLHLCYHGTDLERFQRSKSEEWEVESREQRSEGRGQKAEDKPSRITSVPESDTSPPTHHSQLSTHHSEGKPLSAVYLGAMGSGYDLMTIIQVAARWKNEGSFPVQIHFAGDGPQLEKLKAESRKLKLLNASALSSPSSGLPNARVVFHGFLQKEAINELLLSSDLALVPNRPGSLVACPYKAGEYAAAGLPMISCLGGELRKLLKTWDAGSGYNEGDNASMHAAFAKYSNYPDVLNQQSLNAKKMAEKLFNRTRTYSELANFICS